jgi:hypothetical protein
MALLMGAWTLSLRQPAPGGDAAGGRQEGAIELG